MRDTRAFIPGLPKKAYNRKSNENTNRSNGIQKNRGYEADGREDSRSIVWSKL